MEAIELPVKPRNTFRKRVRYLRRVGLIPANVYGRGMDSVALQVEKPALLKALTRAGRNTPVSLKIEGEAEPCPAFIWGIQRHPVTEEILHVDFYKVDLTRTIETHVPLHLVGEAPAVRLGASIIQSLAELHIECLPTAIPRSVEVDVSALTEMDQRLMVKDLKVPEGINVLSPPNLPVVRAAPPRKEEVLVAPVAEAEAAAPAAEEGEAKPEAEAEGPAKPEAKAPEGKAPEGKAKK